MSCFQHKKALFQIDIDKMHQETDKNLDTLRSSPSLLSISPSESETKSVDEVMCNVIVDEIIEKNKSAATDDEEESFPSPLAHNHSPLESTENMNATLAEHGYKIVKNI